MMTTNVWLNQEWSDYKLKWDPSEYGGIEDINLPAEQIWLPDIVLYNSAEGYFAVSIMTKAKVRYDGYVTWNPPAIFRSSCQIDITYFPFDSQNCNLKFGSWTFGNKIDLRHINDTDQAVEQGTDLSEYYQNVEWDIMKATAKRNIITYTCCPDDIYPDVTFNFTLRRKPLFYTVNLILPCVGITILSFLVFYLPSDSGEKVTLTISILVSLIFFLSVLIETIPSTSLAMPLLGKYLVFTMILITVSVCATVCVLNIHFRTPSTHSMPDWVKRWCIHILPKYLLMNVPYYQNQQQGNILPEQLIYPHNQAYQQHSANWLTTNSYAAFEESTGANSGKVKSNEQSSDGSKRIEMNNIQTLDPRLLNQQFNTSQIMSSSSLFLPYLQSEAARRLKLQRSRSSERDQRSTSDCQGHPEQSSSSNNCDTVMMNHMVPTPTPLITTTNHDRLIKREKVAKDESQRDVSKESKKKKSFVSRLIGGSGATDDNESKKFGDEKQASQDSKNQQETSSSADNDYQYHNHFQARASICSTNLWRIGPTRRCSMAVVPNYPTFYRPLVQPNQTLTTQSGQINTISGCVVHNHDHNNIDSKGLNPQPGQTVGALVTSSAKNLPIRAKQQLLRPPESVMQPKFIAQDRSLGAQEVPLNVIRLAQLPQQQSNAFTIPDNYLQNAPHVNVSMPTPPPPLPPSSHMDTMIRQNTDQFHEGTAHTSSQMFFQPQASHSLHSQGVTSELGSGRRDLNNIANYNSMYMTSLPPLTNPVYGGLAYNQVRLNNQSRYVSSTNGNMTFLSTPLGDGVQQRANAQPQLQYQAPAGYYMSRSKSTDQRLHSYTKERPNGNPTGCRKQSMNQESLNQFTPGHTSSSQYGFGSNLLHEHHQTPESIGRALGQAYLQKLQRQPTVCSTHSTDQARISRTMQRGRAFNVPLNVGQVEYRTSSDQVRRSRSQNSLSRRSFDQVDGNNCEECNSLYRSSGRNNRIAGDCPYPSIEDSCNCDIKSRRLNTYGYAQIDASLRCRMLKTDFCHGASRQDSAGESFQVKGLMRSCCAAGNGCDKISTLSRRPPPLTKLGLMKLVEEVDKAIQNAMFIAQHIDNLDEFESVKENWKFIAMVIDRIFLIVFFFACIAGTVTIFAMVPWSYYTHEKPIDLRLTAETALSRSCQDF